MPTTTRANIITHIAPDTDAVAIGLQVIDTDSLDAPCLVDAGVVVGIAGDRADVYWADGTISSRKIAHLATIRPAGPTERPAVRASVPRVAAAYDAIAARKVAAMIDDNCAAMAERRPGTRPEQWRRSVTEFVMSTLRTQNPRMYDAAARVIGA